MNLKDAVNAINSQSLAAKRFLEKKGLSQPSDELIAKAMSLAAQMDSLMLEITALRHGLHEVPLGDLRQLCRQLGYDWTGLTKDELVTLLLDLRR